MGRGSVARAVFEGIRRVAEAARPPVDPKGDDEKKPPVDVGKGADDDGRKPPAGPEGDGDGDGAGDGAGDDEPKGSERRGGGAGPGGDGGDTGKGFAPDANMTIKDDGAGDDAGGDDSVKKDVFDFIVGKRSPDDAAVHAFAGSVGMEPDDLEAVVYSILGSMAAGRSVKAGLRDENVDPRELSMGEKVELEHTDLPLLARRIAMDHLAEVPDYYTRLKKMEDEAKAAGSVADVPGGKGDEGPPRAPTSWPNAPEEKDADDEEDEDEAPEVTRDGKREPYHSMDVHDGKGEDDGW